MVEDNDSIDMRQIVCVAKYYRTRLLLIFGITVLFAMVFAYVLPKKYESTVVVRVKNSSKVNTQNSALASLLGAAGAGDITKTYIEMIQSRKVLEPVIAQIDLPQKETLQVQDFAKSYLKIENTKGTDLLEIAAIGKNPNQAQEIASAVLKSFKAELTRLNQTEQSLMASFLKERLFLAKKELEQAEFDLEKFRQQEKIFVPEEQAKSLVLLMSSYDQKYADLRIQNETKAAKLRDVTIQLNKQNIAIEKYSLTDNVNLQSIRTSLVNKQVELVGLEQKFTDKHPSIILLRREITELTNQLKKEVTDSLRAETISLNPIHAGLLSEKVQTEIELSVGQASIEALLRTQIEKEEQIKSFSAKSLEYIRLDRNMKIAQEVYGALVRNYEQTRIQEAMESMDIQVVDDANLPMVPSAPRKVFVVAVGVVLGGVFSFIYLINLFVVWGKFRCQQV